MMKKPFSFILDTAPRTKKNHGQSVTLKNGRRLMLPSKAYVAFEKAVLEQLDKNPVVKEPISEPINLKCIFYKDKAYRSDLVGYLQAIQDALVKAGVLEDDNSYIVDTVDGSRVELDREYPRIEVTITYK